MDAHPQEPRMTSIFNRMTPVSHSTLMNSVRVSMWVSDGEYTLCVGDGLYRRFNEDTLPKRIKALMAMIKAFPPNDVKGDGTTLALEAYINTQDPRLNEVGWRVNKDIYMLVLERQFFDSLVRGDHGAYTGNES